MIRHLHYVILSLAMWSIDNINEYCDEKFGPTTATPIDEQLNSAWFVLRNIRKHLFRVYVTLKRENLG